MDLKLNPQLDLIAAECADDGKEADKVLAFVQGLEVTSAEQYLSAGEVVKTIAQGHDAQKAKRSQWTKPFSEVIDAIKELADPVVKALALAEETAKLKIGTYAERTALQRSAGIERAGRLYERGDVDSANAVLDETKTLDVPKIPGVPVKTTWTGEMVNADDLIEAVIAGRLGREYLLPNVALCQTVTEAKEADPGIPGWRAFPQAAVRTSRKG